MNNLQLEHFNVTGHSDFPFKFTLKGYAEDAVGQIIIDKGIVKFEGNFDESAKTFIDFVAKRWSEQWKDLEKRANEFDQFMGAMDTAKEALAMARPEQNDEGRYARKRASCLKAQRGSLEI